MPQDRDGKVKRILELAEAIYDNLSPRIPTEWFSSDLTVTMIIGT